MTKTLFSEDAYLKQCSATVTAVSEQGVILDQTVFYPLGGGQPGDTGRIETAGGAFVDIVDTRKGEGGDILHLLEDGHGLQVGDAVTASLDWDRRHIHMRMHTGLHLLGSLVPFGVTGGNISVKKSRLDFDMETGVDKEKLQQDLAALIAADHPLRTRWITDEELDAQPELVRTMSVQPPRGAGKVRLLEIADVDLQPCGGTHVRSTAEVGAMRIGKVENKGRHNRRINVHIDD
jgi:misacylated tRNA(Ala) deacylase